MTVFHLDIESFITSVERLKHPDLRQRPLVVAPARERALILAGSPDAKALGITKGMPVSSVRKQFPGVRIIPPDFPLYNRANEYVHNLAMSFSPIIEPMNYGHLALDMRGTERLHGSPEDAALKLSREITNGSRLQVTVGIAENKLVSAVAAKEIQIQREPLYYVRGGDEPPFLAPLPCRALPEWETTHIRRLLFELNMRRIQHIQQIPRDIFGFAVGADGVRLHRHAHGIDPSPVTPPRQMREIRREHIFAPDSNHDPTIRAALTTLVEQICYQLRAKHIACDQARLEIRYTDDVHKSFQFKFADTQLESVIAETILAKIEHWCARRRRLRRMRLAVGGLHPHHEQPSLFSVPKKDRLAPHIDRIRRRFGETAILKGSTSQAKAS